MTMFTLQEAGTLIGAARLIGAGATPIDAVSTDTRAVGAGDLFFALKGERFDAHDFLAQAAARGAVAAVVSDAARGEAAAAAGMPVLVVDDTRRALGALASAWRQGFDTPLAAVTGSNGKTTVKEMIAAIFSAAVGESRRLATRGNLNNDIGVPLTLLRLDAGHRLAVVELGMNHPGETELLARYAQPNVVVVNNAQREHQEFMINVEAVALEHASAIHALRAGGTAVFPASDAYAGIWRVAATDRQIVEFAFEDEMPAAGATVSGHFDGAHLRVTTPAGSFTAALKTRGRHNAHNALAACAAALACQVSLAAIQAGLEAFEPVRGRQQIRTATLGPLAGATVIDDTYNANPDSMRAAIDVLALANAPRALVIGDMGEIGDDAAAAHREIGSYARERGIERLFALGEASRFASEAFGSGGWHFGAVDALLEALSKSGLDGSATLLVKGSRFMAMERVVDALAGAGKPANGPVGH